MIVASAACPAPAVGGPGGARVALSGGNSSAVERQPSKLGVAGSNPVSRSTAIGARVGSRGGVDVPPPGTRTRAIEACAHVAQLAEHALGKGEVSGSIPDMGSRFLHAGTGTVDGR